MALQTAILKSDLRKIFNDPKTQNNANDVADAMAAAFEKYVKTGTVTGVDSRGDVITNLPVK